MKSVCVFCGSSPGADRAYKAAALAFAEAMTAQQLTLVYGGGGVGLMGEIADAVLARGGRAVGVIPRALAEKEVAHLALSELHVVESMHERKTMMYDLSDAFIALPGGIGTLEEFFEILTWAQLGMHDQPCGVLNTRGYYDRLLDFLDHAVTERFFKAEHRAMVLVDSDPQALLARCQSYAGSGGGEKWLDRATT